MENKNIMLSPLLGLELVELWRNPYLSLIIFENFYGKIKVKQ